MQIQKERGVISIPFYFWAKQEEGESSCRADSKKTKQNKKTLESIFTEKKLLLIDRKYKDKRSWVLKGLDRQHVRGYCHPSKKQFVPPTHPLCFRAFGSKRGGWLFDHPLSPLEAPTVCQGAQGAQWALVNAFQESGSGERGGEAEGGLALRNAARSRGDSRGTGRAKHKMPTN